MHLFRCLLSFSIYTLSDLGDLSKLIGSLSRTIQQYSPPSKFCVSSKQGKEWYRKKKSYLEQPNLHFCQHFMRKTTQQTLLAINLSSQQKTTTLYFSSQVRKQFKLLAVPFKPLRCCLRNDKLVNCHVWKFCKDLFLNLRVIWSVNQIVLFNGFLSDFVEITSCVYTKTIILFNLGE